MELIAEKFQCVYYDIFPFLFNWTLRFILYFAIVKNVTIILLCSNCDMMYLNPLDN